MKKSCNAFNESDRLMFRVSSGFYILLCWYLELSAYQWVSALLGFVVVTVLVAFVSGFFNLSAQARIFACLGGSVAVSVSAFLIFSC